MSDVKVKMFSKAEIEFLTDPKQVSDNYERSLTHRILTKLKDFEEALPLLENNPKTRAWLQGIAAKNSGAAEFSNKIQNQNKPNLSPIPGKSCPTSQATNNRGRNVVPIPSNIR